MGVTPHFFASMILRGFGVDGIIVSANLTFFFVGSFALQDGDLEAAIEVGSDDVFVVEFFA